MFLVKNRIKVFLVSNAVVVPFSIIILVPMRAVDKIPVNELDQKGNVQSVEKEITNMSFVSEFIPFIINVILHELSSENANLI